MGQPIPYIDRVKIVRLRQKSQSFAKIAKELGYSTEGVRKIWGRYDAHGMEGLKTCYQNSGRRSPY